MISPLPSSGCRNRKPRLFAAIGVFAFLFFVNQKPADFLLSARVAPWHFLVNYSAERYFISAPTHTLHALSRDALPDLSTVYRLHTSSV
ncbi:hypothetical protein BWA55_16420 [Salmonella enterica]|nr:hypothetical protein [Salmonella enterica]